MNYILLRSQLLRDGSIDCMVFHQMTALIFHLHIISMAILRIGIGAFHFLQSYRLSYYTSKLTAL